MAIGRDVSGRRDWTEERADALRTDRGRGGRGTLSGFLIRRGGVLCDVGSRHEKLQRLGLVASARDLICSDDKMP